MSVSEHTAYGHPCTSEGDSYDESTCALAGCEEGYYYVENVTCQKAAYTWSTYNYTPCDFGRRTVVSYTEALQCMRTLPLDKEGENKNTIPYLLEYLESSRDVMLNPPAPLTGQCDIVGRLTAIDSATSYTNGYDFHRDIAHVINRLQDGHTSYTIPCDGAFAFALPLAFQIDSTSDGDYTVSMVPNPALGASIFSHWLSTGASLTHLAVVSSIYIPGLPQIANEKPEVTLARFAEKLSLLASMG